MATSHIALGENIAVYSADVSTASAASAAATFSSLWIDCRDASSVLALYTRSVGTGVLTTYRIDVASSSAGANATVVKTGTATTVDAVGDMVQIEVSAQEIRAAADAAGIDGRYISLVVIHPTATEHAVVTYLLSSLRPRQSLTADHIA